MFKNIIEYFTKSQEIKDKRFEDFEQFHIECIKTFPIALKKRLQKKSIHVVEIDKSLEKDCGNKHSEYIMGFTNKDVLWWRENYKMDNFTIKDITEIKNKVKQECLDIIDDVPLGDVSYLDKLYK